MDEEKSIKHLVVSGGGTYGLSAYGALRELSKRGFWDISNIKSCHATSIGTLILVMILCKYEWDTGCAICWTLSSNYPMCVSRVEACRILNKKIYHG